MITKQIKNSSFTLDLHGARITLRLNGHDILVKTLRNDGKVGSTHPCTPNFSNPNNPFGLPQHGPARDADWKLLTETEDTVTISYYVEGGTYPKGLKVMQTLHLLEHQFNLYTVHTNTGTEPMPVIFGEHFYWEAPHDIDAMRINGLELSSFRKFKENFHTIGVVIPFDFKNTVEIPGKPIVVLEQENMPVGMLWQGSGDTGYICVEPVTMNPQIDEQGKPYFGSKASLINPGETKTAFVSLSVS